MSEESILISDIARDMKCASLCDDSNECEEHVYHSEEKDHRECIVPHQPSKNDQYYHDDTESRTDEDTICGKRI